MRRLLSSWLLFAAIWIPAHALAALLVERRLSLTRAAFWSAILIPLVQAVAVESLDRPLLDGSLGRALRGLFVAPRIRIFGGAGALALVVEAAAAAGWLPNAAAIVAATAMLALAAAALANRAFGRRSLRHAVLGSGAALTAAALAVPGFVDLLPTFGGPAATPAFAAIVAGTLAGAALALALADRAPEAVAALYAGAAGAIVVAGLLRAVPTLLGAPFDARRAVPVAMLLTCAATAAGAAALAERLERERA